MKEAALVSLVVVAGALVGWRLRRRHRGVPLGWSTSQSEAAELHRRLHRAVDDTRQTVARVGAKGAPVDELVALSEDLSAEALVIDRELEAASHLPDGSRRKTLMEIKQRIVESERLSARVKQLAVDLATPTHDTADDGIRRLHERLDALDEARRELRDLGRIGKLDPEAPEDETGG
jgi:hypothetical protein